jgi:hypothetical protein
MSGREIRLERKDRILGHRISLSTLVLAVAVIGVICGIVRWGLRLPNLLANQAIQPIVVGSAPTVALIGLGCLLTLRDWVRRERPRPFWMGFLACGTIAVIAYSAHSLFIGQDHYAGDYEMMFNAALRRCGMTWNPGAPADDTARYPIVITGLVVLLALPQVLFATLGGWVMERSSWARRVAMEPEESGTAQG